MSDALTDNRNASNPLLSIIIPCFNSEQYIFEALNSTLQVNLISIELIINVNEKKNGCLEFLLNKKTAIFNINLKNNLIKYFIKKILNIYILFMKKNDFTELTCIKESKINFFSYD